MELKNSVKLLTFNNAKTIKGEKLGYKTAILYLSPYRSNSIGKNVCSHASESCIKSCLFESGHGSISSVKFGRIRKTDFFLSNREQFISRLMNEISNLKNKHKDMKVCVRLNGTSDIAWERFKVAGGKSIMEVYNDVIFYDYSKNPTRFKNPLPKNYSLIFSRSETNEEECFKLLKKGVNVAMVFDKLPQTYKGYKVINGDESDLRFLDEKGIIVGLKYKKLTGKGAREKNIEALKNGFVIVTDENEKDN